MFNNANARCPPVPALSPESSVFFLLSSATDERLVVFRIVTCMFGRLLLYQRAEALLQECGCELRPEAVADDSDVGCRVRPPTIFLYGLSRSYFGGPTNVAASSY